MKRRAFLAGSGGIVVSFALAGRLEAQQGAPSLPGSLAKAPRLDSWIRLDPAGRVTIFTGKCEFGQGIKTALMQIAAEELEVPFSQVTLVTADTARTANEGFTSGSRSLLDSGTAIRHAAAQVRALQRVQQDASGAAPDLKRDAEPKVSYKDAKGYRIVGQSVPRVDIPAKVTGGQAYVQDLRLPGMLHARVVRPPGYGARLASLDGAAVEALPDVVKVIRDGDFVAVVAKREWSAVKAMRALQSAARWEERASLPDMEHLPEALLALQSEDTTIHEQRTAESKAAKTLEATYTRHYQAHGSIGPSCAVAQMKDGALTVWSHTQGVFPDRDAIAQMLRMPPAAVRVVHLEGSGCYGHNGADDAAADAALIAAHLPGAPVRVQWMRDQEHQWEPYGPAMVAKVRAGLDSEGRIVDWDYGVWSNSHSTRPGGAGSLLAANLKEDPIPLPPQKAIRSAEGLGDRNAIPLYRLPNARVVHHFLPSMPLRVSALRSLGAYMNVFAIESFMDELARAAGADPVAFRLAHLDDDRARTVVQAAARRFGWSGRAGQGFAFARYKNAAAYCAVAVEAVVQEGRVRVVRAAAAVDAGQVVNPDGLRNQVEGAILQAASWTLHEKVAFDHRRIKAVDWASYPILRFAGIPSRVEIEIVDRPGMPSLGSGECGQGPAGAAIANAVASLTGQRLRDIPIDA